MINQAANKGNEMREQIVSELKEKGFVVNDEVVGIIFVSLKNRRIERGEVLLASSVDEKLVNNGMDGDVIIWL